jgi:hypothetical protein
VFGNTEEKRIVILGVAGLFFGIKVMMAPVEGWFQIGSPFSYWVLVKHWLASYYSS